jgi:hypothetical protein
MLPPSSLHPETLVSCHNPTGRHKSGDLDSITNLIKKLQIHICNFIDIRNMKSYINDSVEGCQNLLNKLSCTSCMACERVYPKVSGLAAWSENCKWYSSLPLGAVVSLCLVSFASITVYVAPQ